LTIDLRKIIRLRKPEKHQTRLTNHPDTDLIRASDVTGTGRQAFLPDTNAYIMDAAGILPLGMGTASFSGAYVA
jgi:hypothetical protein